MAPSWSGHHDHTVLIPDFKPIAWNDVALGLMRRSDPRPIAKGLTSKTGAQLSKMSQEHGERHGRSIRSSRYLGVEATRWMEPRRTWKPSSYVASEPTLAPELPGEDGWAPRK